MTAAKTTVAALACRVAELESALARFEQMLNRANAEQPKPVAQPQQPSLRRFILVMVTFGTTNDDWNIARAVAKERALATKRFGYRVERCPDRDALRVIAVEKAH